MNYNFQNSPKQGELIKENIICETPYYLVKKEIHRLSNDEEHEYSIAHAPDWVLILPIDENGDFVMIWQYRAGWRRSSLEFPAGRLEVKENELDAAKRELKEETGYTAKNWKLLGSNRPVTWTTQKAYFYLASELTVGTTNFDTEEDIETVKIKPDNFWEFVESGDIVELPTITAFTYYQRINSKNK
ncbi:MAG: NUDIX domain-containing protein [Candidatus Heimdallarchaeota archaeon]|nr:NUDIX domain-containing protein [Candidatus Heimdallarchaeota archaeon]MDH5647532.1 NUDIX domain-containing protein [Candidatus Heimdallarchaeota archaeon]